MAPKLAIFTVVQGNLLRKLPQIPHETGLFFCEFDSEKCAKFDFFSRNLSQAL